MVEQKKVRLHAIVEGYVQGVGFRMFVQTTAYALGVTGWVRNLWNGNVEVVAEGEQNILEKLNQYLWQGPRNADVVNVHSEWLEATNEFERFQVRANG
ncbi:MAG: acylphosphatase [Chloroflexi bacterium]|nr:acylphosphatase [Chloroflexota bacterium]